MKKLLVVVDMQNDFVYGSLQNTDAEKIIPSIEKKIKGYISQGDTVVFTRDTHGGNYLETEEGRNLPVVHCLQNSDGWQIVAPLQKQAEIVFDKTTFGSFELATFAKNSNFDQIEFVGVCTDICVISCALLVKAACPYTRVLVDKACCAGVTVERHQTALDAMSACHIEIF